MGAIELAYFQVFRIHLQKERSEAKKAAILDLESYNFSQEFKNKVIEIINNIK